MRKCILTGTEIHSVGSAKSASFNRVDGVSTVVGLVHRSALDEVQELLEQAEEIAIQANLAIEGGAVMSISQGTIHKIARALAQDKEIDGRNYTRGMAIQPDYQDPKKRMRLE